MSTPIRRGRIITTLGLAAVTATALVGCSSDDTASAAGSDGLPVVVASTNVWGSVAEAVVGDRATVQSIIEDPSADPHSYEASPADAAAITEASLVVYNGGGYDEFVDDILDAGGDTPSVDAYSLLGESGHSDDETHSDEAHSDETHSDDEAGHSDEAGDDHGHDHSGPNEHVWYDPEVAAATAEAIASELGAIDPDNAQFYTDNAEAFHDSVHEITDITDRIAEQRPDAPVAQTEPIAHYLLEAAGLRSLTPDDFVDAIEEGNDPSPASIAATRDLFTDREVEVLVYNTQTEDAVTSDIRATAESNDVPVVEVTETLPADTDYVTWQKDAAQSLADALGVTS